jgi:hypothetical protein
MGWDVLELVMAIEERFRVTIPDERAERIHTVGELYVFLLERARKNAPIPCPTSRAFYRLRRTLLADGVDRARVRPATAVRDLFDPEARATAWPRLAAALELSNPPDIDPPPRGPTRRAFGIALAVAMLLPCLALLPLRLQAGGNPPFIVELVLSLLAALGVCLLFGAFWLDGRYLHPALVPRVRDLVLTLAARDTGQPQESQAESAPAAVWANLVAVLSKHTGVAADQIRPEYRFGDELAP